MHSPPAAYPFVEVPPVSSKITWVHSAGKSALKHLPEISGAGCAFLDYDNDGWMDIYLVNSGKADFYHPNNAAAQCALPQQSRRYLYRRHREGRASAAACTEWASPSGDYDNDGFPDLYVTQYGRSILYHNNGDGTFTDVTDKAGVAAPGWASSAVWFDYDNDGRLDLFVGHFAAWDPSQSLRHHADGARHYCIPRIFKPTSSWLFHNNGDGTFTDVSKESGIAEHLGKAWGVVATDINNDGLMDLFVSNDTVANFLFLNKGNGRFEEIGLAGRRSLQRRGQGAFGHGRGLRRLQSGRLDGPLRRQHRRRDVRALQEQWRPDASTTSPCRWASACPRDG